MAEGKKSFIAYSDWHAMFKLLPDEVAGKLIKHVFSYVNDEEPETDDFIIKALFEQIKATLKRDLQKWDKQREQRVDAGKKSAEIRSTKSNDRSTTVNETERNPTVSVSVSVNDSVKEDSNLGVVLKSDKSDLNFDTLLDFINEKTGRKFKLINQTVKVKLKARIKDGYTKHDIRNAIVNACNQAYHKENGYQYLTPEFFSRASNLDKYGNSSAKVSDQKVDLFKPKTETYSR